MMPKRQSTSWTQQNDHSKVSLQRLWRDFRLPILFVCALLITLLIGVYARNSSVVLVLVTIIIDMMLVWRWRREQGPYQAYATLLAAVVINVLAIIALFSVGAVERWVSTFYCLILFSMLTLDRLRK